MSLFFWIFRNVLEAGFELPNRSLLWLPAYMVMFAAEFIGWPYAAIHYSPMQLIEYSMWLLLANLILIVALCRVWWEWLMKGEQNG